MARTKRYKKKEKTASVEFQVVLLVIISILLAVLIYTKSGYIGEQLSPILGGLIGWIKYIIPFGTMLIALYITYEEEKEYMTKKLIQYFLFLLCISTIITIIQISNNSLQMQDEFEKTIVLAYERGTKNLGGGAIGAIVAIPLIKYIGSLGGIILSAGFGLILSIYIFGLKPAKLLKEKIEAYKEKSIDKREERRIKREEKSQEKIEDIVEDKINIKISGENKSPIFKEEEKIEEKRTKEVLVLPHAITKQDIEYAFPPIELLKEASTSNSAHNKKNVEEIANQLQKTLYSFGVSAKVQNVSVGPTITRYEVKPAEGVRVNKIASLADDIALNLAAETIRIEPHIPGKQAVGIEIPNRQKDIVSLREIIESSKFKKEKSKVAFALGKDAAGEEVITDIAKMPHLLIAGSTGSR